MRQQAREVDIVDVHVTSQSERVDCFSQYPLLDGERKYTVELTEFVSPLAGHEALPSVEWFAQQTETFGDWLTLRRKRTTAPAIAHIDTLLPAVPLAGPAPDITFTPDEYIFRKDTRRTMATPGEFVYQLQRFFDDIKFKYVFRGTDDQRNTLDGHITTIIQNQAIIALANTPQEVADATADIAAEYHAISLLPAAARIYFDSALYGGGAPLLIEEDIHFVTVSTTPNGTLQFLFSQWFCDHFWIDVNQYGQTLLGLPEKYIAFRLDGANLLTGLTALSANGLTVSVGGSPETTEINGAYSLERHFDHRVRIEVESQMPIPPTTVWSAAGSQKLSHVIATFPIITTTKTGVQMNNEGVATDSLSYTSSILSGDIAWRRAEDKISERYLLQNSQHFHNIRLDVAIIRKDWVGPEGSGKFLFVRENMVYGLGEAWTAKLRFRSVN